MAKDRTWVLGSWLRSKTPPPFQHHLSASGNATWRPLGIGEANGNCAECFHSWILKTTRKRQSYHKLLIANWNNTSLTDNDHEQVEEDKWYSLGIVGISLTKRLGFNVVELVDGCNSHITAIKLATFVQAGGEWGFSFSFLIYHMTFSQTFSRSYHAKILHCLRLNILLPVFALEDWVSQKDRRWETELAFETFWETPSDLISLVWEWPLNDAPDIHKK